MFGRHVDRAAENFTGLGQGDSLLRVGDHFCNTEVDNLSQDRTILFQGEHDVSRFEIAVDYIAGVGMNQTFGNLSKDNQCIGLENRTIVLDNIAEGCSFEKIHDQISGTVFIDTEIENIPTVVYDLDGRQAARELRELMPQARIAVAHGQMAEKGLEQVMLDFYRQRCNVLVCSTIVENGIDVPSANTIIIERADKFGLSQLHQLRGRVGRSHHRAYAYLLVPDRKAMTGDAVKRLEALASLEELGAGFTLATHDLEIRGAGELLGEEQSGQIQEVGFSLYSEYLERAVNALKAGKIPDLDADRDHGAEVELNLPALIPSDYMPDVHTRLTLYKRIAGCRSEDELDAMKVEMIDRFGLLPEPTRNLFAVSALKLKGGALGIKKLVLGPQGGRLQFEAKPKVDPMVVVKLIQRENKRYGFDGPDRLKIRATLEQPAERLALADTLLNQLGNRHAA